MSPFKNYYSQEVETWISNHPFRSLSSYQVEELMEKAYAKIATLQIAMSGFKKCGIMPFDRNRFSEADFLPSVYEITIKNRSTVDPQNDTSLARCRPTTTEDIMSLPSGAYLELVSPIGVGPVSYTHLDVYKRQI